MTVAEAVIEPDVAEMVVVPGASAVTNPPGAIVATAVEDELQLTAPVRSCVLPSVYVPVAVNCCVVPKGIVGFFGLIAIEANVAGFTTNVAVALTEPELTPMIVVPSPSVVANPAVPGVTLIVATAGTLELHCPLCVRSCVVPSVYVPVAVNCCVAPKPTVAVCGLIAIDTSVAAVTVNWVEPVAVPEVALMLAEPTLTPCANPVALIVAIETVSDDQVAVPVRSCLLLSVNVPVAVNCWLVPTAIDGVVGVTANDTSVTAVTVSFVDPVTEPDAAVMVAVPWATPVAKPAVGGTLLIVATAGVSELH